MEMPASWKAGDGAEFAIAWWPATAPPTGLMVCVHGLGGAADDFATLGQAVSRAGISCCALNLRGQGNDPATRRRGAWLDVAALGAEIAEVVATMRGLHPGVPVFLCGESMGALLVARAVADGRFPDPVAGIILSAPVVQLRRPTPRVVRNLVRWLAAGAPHLRVSPSWFVSGSGGAPRVTRDDAHEAKVRASPHFLRTFTIRFLHELGTLIESSPSIASRINVPTLVLVGGQDVYVRPDQVREWFDQMPAKDKTLRTYPEAFHLLWNDWDRETVLRDITDWVTARARA